jgi:hypothetical protein
MHKAFHRFLFSEVDSQLFVWEFIFSYALYVIFPVFSVYVTSAIQTFHMYIVSSIIFHFVSSCYSGHQSEE